MTTSDPLSLVIAIAQSIVGLISLFVAYAALSLSVRVRQELSLSEQIGNIHDLFVLPYQERTFRKPLHAGDVELVTLKDARTRVHAELKPQANETSRQAMLRFLARTMVSSSWENVFAYEVSLGLEAVGAAVLAGALPLSFVLASNADQIVEDWLYCHKLVEERLRTQPGVPRPLDDKLATTVSFHRIHGEWLVYASALWMANEWRGGHVQELITEMGGLDVLRKRERELRHFSSELLSDAGNHVITKLLGTRN